MLALLLGACLLNATVLFSLIPFDGQSYCWVYPSIDTRYAPGFDERRFRTIRVGDTAESVKARLGEPLKRSGASGSELWRYSYDGKLRAKYGIWADYAWLLRDVKIRDGRVSEITSRVIYN